MGMKVMLQQYGFKDIIKIIDQAYNGQEALTLVKNSYFQTQENYNYGLIFMDLSMPIMDGYQASDKIRNFLKNKKMP